ncbi:hypothetical protein [Gordonia alkanivorans]|uniref:Major tail protein n=1 Tax=Gordonia phage Frokostdame TaxID=2250320 RepID=A0A345L304_9CAUD|nr:hypothetical protein [Gordonia alkanivorans]YP_010096891.1 major tail protein [Gordonia phage Frokostdame]AXH49656.1 major tail protein [Gordonia phage Frokostdame]MDJ0006516.1 hypothetical protein [Gordonia alkanivorans]MDJ0492144.1 hypothetical protein [Gordonia alkanivorans]
MAVPTIDGFKADAARVGVTGRIDIASLTAASLPRDMSNLTTTGPGGWTNLGYISDDGVTEGRDEDNQEFVPWQENSAIRYEITKSVVTFEFTLWQSTLATAGFYYGVSADDMLVNADGSVFFDESGKPDVTQHKLVLTVVDGSRARRTCLAAAQVTERGEVTYKSDEMIGYNVTVTGFPGEDAPDGNTLSCRRIFMEGWDTTGLEEYVPPTP